jgi:hypothetical protein
MEQVWCHEQKMAQNISHLNHLIFVGLKSHTQEMKLTTETAQKYWLIYIHAHMLVKSMVNKKRNFDPVGKLTLNVQILEILNS